MANSYPQVRIVMSNGGGRGGHHEKKEERRDDKRDDKHDHGIHVEPRGEPVTGVG